MSNKPHVNLERALRSGGEAGELIASYPWDEHPMGHPDSWPSRLRSAVSMMLSTPYPMHISWGPELFQLYNDGYRPVLGSLKHPAIGVPLCETYPEAMDFILARFEAPLQRGEPYWAEDDLFPVNRHGWLEESHFAFAYSPLDDDEGVVQGVITVCTEITAQVLSGRRLELLSSLTAAVLDGTPSPQLIATAISKLNAVPDIPVAVVLAPHPTGCEIIAQAGLESNAGMIPLTANDLERLAAHGDNGLIPMATLGLTPSVHPAWTEPAVSAWILPVGELQLVVGLHPGLGFDDEYQRFLRLVADAVSSAMAKVRRSEESETHLNALQELDRARDSMISDVSHELRTPLSLIGGAVEELRRVTPSTDADHELLWSIVERNVTRLRKLVNSLLSFGQLEAGHLRAHLEPTELTRLTNEICESFVVEFRRAGLEFDIDTHDVNGQWFMVDPNMWDTAIVNLLSNAHKYTLQGTVTATLTSDRTGDVRFGVTDTGVGIDESQLEQLFERFTRASNRNMGRTDEGAGIGLALVSAIAREHGGDVTVKSAPGVGSTFEIVVPLAQSQPTAESPTDAPAPRDDARTVADASGTVLVVDDSEDILALARLALSRHWQVHTASNGAEALAIVASTPIDCVVTDSMMPVMDGCTLIANLRSDVTTAMLPIVLLSGLNSPDGAAAADLVLQKPFSFSDLLAAIEQLIASSRK